VLKTRNEVRHPTVAAIRLQLGLDGSIPVQFADYSGGLLHCIIGRSSRIVEPDLRPGWRLTG
jgi:hypothetical protein